MLAGNVFPQSIKNVGKESLLSNHYMLAFFKKFCNVISERTWRSKRAKNARYRAEDFLKVFFYSEIAGRSIHDASEQLNAHYLSQKKGRRKSYIDDRKKRLVPHQTGVNAYLRRIGLNKARKILRECLDFQLIKALTEGLVSRKVSVLIDFTEHPYYGKRDDEMIKGTNRAKGTNKMRHYLGFSILSREVHLYAGLEHVANGQSKIPIILDFLSHLLDLGFELKYVLMDREFYRAELINKIKRLGGHAITPVKRYKKVKALITDYLEDKRGRVMSYSFSTATKARHRFLSDVYLIIKAKRGFTLQGVKRDLASSKITLKDAYHRVFAVMTTQKPKGKTSSWASRVALFYRRRWMIETGFSDLNRINRRWRSNHDGVRYLDMMARMLLYNSWKINKKIMQKSEIKFSRSKAWTLNQNQDKLRDTFLSLEKKSYG